MATASPVPPLPDRIDELTAGWLEAALVAGGPDGIGLDVEVASVVVEPLGAAVGFLGDLARLRITYQRGEGPATVIVKLPPADPGGRQVGSMLRAWAREVAFYQEVVPASPGARVPHCHHAAADPEAERWVVVLEDVPSEPVDAITGATPAQAEVAIDALAAFHRAWWGGPTTPRAAFGWMPGFDTTGVGGLAPAWEDATPLFLRRYGHLVPAPTEEWLRRLPTWLPAWSARAATEPLTVVHADYRLDNLLVDGSRVTMIDWQTALRGPGAMDLSSFIVTSLTIDARRDGEEELMGRYAAGLGLGPDERQWLARSYDENLLWWMGQFANNLARLEPDDDAAQLQLDTMIERTFTAALDRDAGRLIGSGA